MRLTYDPRRHIGCSKLREKFAGAEAVRVCDELRVELAPDGATDSVELLNANVHRADWGGVQVLLVDDASSERREIALPVL